MIACISGGIGSTEGGLSSRVNLYHVQNGISLLHGLELGS